MRFKILTLILFAPYSILFAQGYYPLTVGNQWDYGELDYPGQFTYLYSLRIVGDTTMPNGKNYAIEKSIYGTRYLRQQDSVLYLYHMNRDTVLYNYSFHDGETALFVQNGQYFTAVVVHVSEGEIFGRTLRFWGFVTTTNTSTDGGSSVTVVDSLGRSYTFVDGGYTEYLMGAIINGKQYGAVTNVTSHVKVDPSEFQLFQNFPNPFNPVTTIEYYVPVRTDVVVELYSTLGKKIAVIFHGLQDPGQYVSHIDGSKLSSGVYFVRLTAKNVSISKPIVLLK